MDNVHMGPENLEEFEKRLLELVCYLRGAFFGISHEVEIGKTIRREKTNEILVGMLCKFEKYAKEKKDEALLHEEFNTYEFLKLALESDAAFDSMYILGVERDRSGITLPQKNTIAVQAAAQVLWHLEGSNIPTIEAMEHTLLDKNLPLFDLLELHRFIAPRTIENWVRAVFPVPQSKRRKYASKDISAFKDIVQIPGIFTEKGVGFPRMRFAIISITTILKTLGWSVDAIFSARPITLIADQLQYYPKYYVLEWIAEAYFPNGRIFDQ